MPAQENDSYGADRNDPTFHSGQPQANLSVAHEANQQATPNSTAPKVVNSFHIEHIRNTLNANLTSNPPQPASVQAQNLQHSLRSKEINMRHSYRNNRYAVRDWSKEPANRHKGRRPVSHAASTATSYASASPGNQANGDWDSGDALSGAIMPNYPEGGISLKKVPKDFLNTRQAPPAAVSQAKPIEALPPGPPGPPLPPARYNNSEPQTQAVPTLKNLSSVQHVNNIKSSTPTSPPAMKPALPATTLPTQSPHQNQSFRHQNNIGHQNEIFVPPHLRGSGIKPAVPKIPPVLKVLKARDASKLPDTPSHEAVSVPIPVVAKSKQQPPDSSLDLKKSANSVDVPQSPKVDQTISSAHALPSVSSNWAENSPPADRAQLMDNSCNLCTSQVPKEPANVQAQDITKSIKLEVESPSDQIPSRSTAEALKPADDGNTGHNSIGTPNLSLENNVEESSQPLTGEGKIEIELQESTFVSAKNLEGSMDSNAVVEDGVVLRQSSTEPLHPLMGWDGKWAPPTVEWDIRPSFDPRGRDHVNGLKAWAQERADEARNNPVAIDVQDPGFGTGAALAVGGARLEQPIDSKVHDTLLPDDDFTHAKASQTAEGSVKTHKAKIDEVVVDLKAERRAFRKAIKFAAAQSNSTPNPHTPKANIYVRPANTQDFAQIAEIYNHYINNCVVAAERSALDEHQWRARWEDATSSSYAFLVAAQQSPKGGGYSRRTSQDIIVGFAYADDWGDRSGAWRFTCELQVYTANWLTRAGVGKSLMDRMMTALDPHYSSRGGVKFVGGPDAIEYDGGGKRVVKKVIINIPFSAKEEGTLKWLKEWLGQWKFEQVAILPGVGRKFDNPYVT